MSDEIVSRPAFDNLRGLVHDVNDMFDLQMAELRKGTPHEHVRPADAKMFMLISRQPRSLSELARVLGISRQAAHKSVARLQSEGVIEMTSLPGNNRDKIPALTADGVQARRFAAENIAALEADIISRIGAERAECMRAILKDIIATKR